MANQISKLSNSEARTNLSQIKVLLVDPSLFTPTYDKALSDGLAANDASVSWAIRGTRIGEDEDDLAGYPEACRFYRLTDNGRAPSGRFAKLFKGIEHWYGLYQLTKIAREFDVVHFQWTPLPLLDAIAMKLIKKRAAVVLTVHDVMPLNGAKDGMQVLGFSRLFHEADRLIVHTDRARDSLIERRVPASKIAVIPHGPLTLRCAPSPMSGKAAGRWQIVLFGRLKEYKGVDLLIDALGQLSLEKRGLLEVIVAGEPTIPVEPLVERALKYKLDDATLKFIFKRLTNQEMSNLLSQADTFVFPYRTIDASGVLFLVAGMQKWIIASPLGAFVDFLEGHDELGKLVDPNDAAALGQALVDSVGRVPHSEGDISVPKWETIGRQTIELYRSVAEH